MNFDKREMIEALKLELEFLKKGGYEPSVHSPHEQPRAFRDSISCINLGLPDDRKEHPCSDCFLIEFVPEAYRTSNDYPCAKIPLNEQGDTIESLQSNPEKRQAALRAWVEKTIAMLEEELELKR